MRYEYDLSPESVVWDVGGYDGDFAAEIFRRYGCRVLVFEPIHEFYTRIAKRFDDNMKIDVVHAGLGPMFERATFRIKGSMTGQWAEGESEDVILYTPETFLLSEGIQTVDLMKLNIEGMEIPLLERMLANGTVTRFKNIAVQFHWVLPNSEERANAIIEGLKQTHDQTWGIDPSFHINFKLRENGL